MKHLISVVCLSLLVGAGAWGCSKSSPKGQRLEEHVKDAANVDQDLPGPRLTEAGGGQGSGATGTNGTGVSGKSPEGTGDPDTASGGDSSN